jgi:glycosyltransferase involved in cell wall biosynthesis
MRTGRGSRRIAGYDGRLVALEPTKWLPRAAGPAADALLRLEVRRGLRRQGWAADLIWVNDPGWWHFARSGSWGVLYDITDDWVRAERSGRQHTMTASDDEALLERSDVVVVCSRELERVKGERRPVVLIPNAVDVKAYRAPSVRPDDLPSGTTALYVGTLHEDRFDVALLLETADALHQVGASVALVGPNSLRAAHTAALAAHPAVHLLGARAAHTIPAYLTHAEALIVPHVVTDFTDSLDPIKAYEYLASGRPTISTPVGGFRELAAHPGIRISDRAQFASAVVDLVARVVPSTVHDDIPDWDDRARAMRTVVDEILANRAVGPNEGSTSGSITP